MEKDKIKYPKVGDIITIIELDNENWSSAAGGECPSTKDGKITLPFTGKVLNVSSEYYDHFAANVDGWGFNLTSATWEFAEKEVNYEIY